MRTIKEVLIQSLWAGPEVATVSEWFSEFDVKNSMEAPAFRRSDTGCANKPVSFLVQLSSIAAQSLFSSFPNLILS